MSIVMIQIIGGMQRTLIEFCGITQTQLRATLVYNEIQCRSKIQILWKISINLRSRNMFDGLDLLTLIIGRLKGHLLVPLKHQFAA